MAKRKRTSAKQQANVRMSGGEYSTVAVPEGMEFFRPQSGVRKLDFLPYITKSNPFTPDPEGYEHFERTFWIHRNVGVDQYTYVCPAKTVKKKCPICEQVQRMKKEANPDQDAIKELAAKQRQLWLVIDLEEKDKGVQLWDVSYHLFGRLLNDMLLAEEDESDHEFFYGVEDGSTLRVIFKEKSIGSGPPFQEAVSIQFKKRKPYPADTAEKMPCLDEILIVKSYDELSAIFYQEEGPPAVTDERRIVVEPKEQVPWDDDNGNDKAAASVMDEKEFDDDEDDDWS